MSVEALIEAGLDSTSGSAAAVLFWVISALVSFFLLASAISVETSSLISI